MIEYFADQQVSATPVTIAQAPDSDGHWNDTPSNQTAVKGILFQASTAAAYFNTSWAENITMVFVASDITNLTNKGNVTIEGITYVIETGPEDVGMNNATGWDNVYLLGLAVMT